MGALDKLKRFFWAEEIPRWFGLSLATAYVAGLAALACGAYLRAQEQAAARLIAGKKEAVAVFADFLGADGQDADAYRVAVRRFAASQRCKSVRIYDRQLQVVASLDPTETGQPLRVNRNEKPVLPGDLVSRTETDPADDSTLLELCAPLRRSGVPPTRFVHAVFDVAAPPILTTDPFRAGPWIITLLSTVAFLVVYHRMRRHFCTVTQISETLCTAHDLERELDHLRLTHQSDELSRTWNNLVDLTVSLRDEVSRSTASSELLVALSGHQGGELALAMTAAPLGVMLVNGRGEICYANAMARRLCNWPADDEASLSLDDADLPVVGRAIADALRPCIANRGARTTREQTIDSQDGSFYQLQVIPAGARQQLDRFVVLVNDVSQRVRADRAREEFVSQVTHELRTPLTNIRAYAETLSSGMFDDPKVITECYNVITKETRRLSRLIEDILSISQLEVGTLQLVKDDVDLRALLTESVRDVRGLAESKKIDVQLVLPPKLEGLDADRDKLAVVFNNLLGNALKYTPAGGQVVVTCQVRKEEVTVSVKDTGIGIDAADHDRVFEKFQRADDPDVRAQAGTGIGLTTAREIVRQHGGDITLHSAKGNGSTFIVHLPIPVRVPATINAS